MLADVQFEVFALLGNFVGQGKLFEVELSVLAGWAVGLGTVVDLR